MIKPLYQTSDGTTFETLHEAEEYEAQKLYTVTYTLSGAVCVSVYAKDEEEAKQRAENEWYSDDIDWNVTDIDVEEC